MRLKNYLYYLIAPILSIALFCVIFHIGEVDLSQPIFEYKSDSLYNFFVIKTIIDSGWIFSNDLVGFPHIDGKFYFHDFPIHANSFNFAVMKLISNFISNPFLIANIFFIFTFALISFTSFIALRNLNFTHFSAILISILYAFTPYHLHRNTHHIFLSNYAVIPLTIMVSFWLISNQIKLISINKKEQFCLQPNNKFYFAILIAIFAACSGSYYAIYSGIILAFAWMINRLENGKILSRELLITTVIIGTIIATLLYSYLPAILYWNNNGMTHALGRATFESFNFGLRFSSLLIPVKDHYLEPFAILHNIFLDITFEEESVSESLGTLATTGFLFLILWLIANNFSQKKESVLAKINKFFNFEQKDKKLITYLSSLNIITIIFASAGGMVMFMAVIFPTLRSHARFSVIIAFLALIMVAICYDKIIAKKLFGKKYLSQIFLILLTLLALFDQTGKVTIARVQPTSMLSQFKNDKHFIEKLENKIAKNSQILIMPSLPFPEDNRDQYQSMIGYLHSKNLRWSYPNIKNRQSNIWQENLKNLSFAEFIKEVKKHNFTAILINRKFLATNSKQGQKDVKTLEENLNKIKTTPAISSDDKNWIFYQI